jgi:hypothetical protein
MVERAKGGRAVLALSSCDVSDSLPSGWFPDPTGRCEYRYFNGQSWTADVSVGGQRFLDPLDRGPQPGGFAPKGSGRGFAVASFVIALVSIFIAWVPFIFVLGAVGCILAVVFGVLGLRAANRNGGAGKGFAISGLVLSVVVAGVCVVGGMFTVSVLHELDAWLNPGANRVAITTCASEKSEVRASGTITNESDRARSYTITVAFLDRGTETTRRKVSVPELAAHDSATFISTALVLAPGPITCRVVEVYGPEPFVGWNDTNS